MDLDLVGVAEIAKLLGVSRQRVNQLLHEDDSFPTPVAQIEAGRVWLRPDIEAWARQTGRLRNSGES